MKKTVSIQSQCLAGGLALLTLLGTSACKKGESEQKNFKAETGMLWWKKEATLVPLPYYLAKAPVPGQSNLAADDSALRLEDVVKSCWYYSEKPEDPFFSAKAVSPTAVTLDTLFLGMTEGEHKDTLKDLKETWISNASTVKSGLQGWQVGAVTGAVLSVVAAAVLACTIGSTGVFAGPCIFVATKISAVIAGLSAASTTATTTAGILGAAAAPAGGGLATISGLTITAVEAANLAAAGAAVGAGVGAMAGGEAKTFSPKDFESKLKDLVSTASAEKRMKVEWKQLQALNDIVMKAPSSQATADVCARPEQLDRAAVAAYVGGGTANNATTP